VELYVERLDDVAGELTITARRLSGDGGLVLYAFSVAGERLLLEGRAAVVLDAGQRFAQEGNQG
jgi:predicted hotdog family 3-hydroxylacyl-ACP dehydratase